MNDFLTFLNHNSGAIQVLFSGLVTFATVVYAILTWSLVRETTRMRKAQSDAKVMVSISSRKETISFLDFYIVNEGMGPAYDIKFKVTHLNVGEGDVSIVAKINELGFIQKGIDYLSAKQEIRTFLTSMIDNFELKVRTILRVEVSYRTGAGDIVKDAYTIDFSIFSGMQQLGEPDLYRIAKSIEKIEKNIDHLSTGWSKLQIITQSKSDYIEERQKSMEDAQKQFEEVMAKEGQANNIEE